MTVLALTLYPAAGPADQPRQTPTVSVVATAYCLPGTMANGEKVRHGSIALSRPLARDLGLKEGKRWKFGTVIIVEGVGEFVFRDLMPPRWTHYRVDIWYPTLKQCRVFGVKICKLYAKL